MRIQKVFARTFITLGLVAALVAVSPMSASAAPKATASTKAAYPSAKDVSPEVMHKYVNLVMNTFITPEMTDDQKLYQCYVYVIQHMKYLRDTAPGKQTSMKDYALQAFFSGEGNCYRYASMFAYMAKELGYDVTVHAGQCTSTKGTWTPHSWCVITDADGVELIYDLSFGDSNWGKKNYYGITEEEHSRELMTQEIWDVKF